MRRALVWGLDAQAGVCTGYFGVAFSLRHRLIILVSVSARCEYQILGKVL